VAPPVGQIRPLRYLAFFAFLLILVYGLVLIPAFVGHDKATPKLGIDLQGGTRVTLTARTTTGEAPSRDSLNQARQIIEKRVNGIGVGGTEVLLDGNNIVITVPGDQGDQAKNLGKTAKLAFRKVIPIDQTANQLVQQQLAAKQQPNPGQPTTSTKPGTPTSTSKKPTAGSATPTSGAPQGRVAPHLEGASAPTTTTKPPASSTSKAPPTSSTPAPPPANGSVTPDEAKIIKAAQDILQADNVTTDPQAQAQALLTLSCVSGPGKPGDLRADEELVGNDLPDKPLVTCGKDGRPYVLDKVFLPGTDITDASFQVDSTSVGHWEVDLNFNSQGSNIWADFTSKNVGQQAAFVLDTQVQSAPNIETAIAGGNTRITGDFTQTEAQDLANVLKYGSLPLSFESSDAETVSATLGLASLEAGLIAGAIGLALVFIYCLVYYRLLGILTMLSLAFSAAIVYGVLVLLGRWIGFTLDLPGVAGFIIAIGITADSFVIFFERLKDEIREGRTFRSAVPRGWIRARRTILTADAVMFLAAATLYVLAVGTVQGFAFTLGLSTVLDLLVVFFVTHPLVAIAAKSKTLSSPKFSGLGRIHRHPAGRGVPAKTAAKEA
jgi:preprotein translocase subunit SecD